MLSPKADEYKGYVRREVSLQVSGPYLEGLQTYTHFAAIYLFFDNFQNKDGSSKKKDITNLVKLLEDAICEELGIDDRGFFSVSIHKIQHNGPPRTVTAIKPFREAPSLAEIHSELEAFFQGSGSDGMSKLRRRSGSIGEGCRFILPETAKGGCESDSGIVDADFTETFSGQMEILVPF